MKPPYKHSGFTLVEVLVAASIVVVLMVVLLGMTDQTQRLVRSTSAKVEQFQESRVAFESMTRRLAQATLNTFWDYDDPAQPTRYIRAAELRFRSGSMKNLTGGVGPSGNLQPSHGVFFNAPMGTVDPMKSPTLMPLDHLMNTWGYFVEIGSDADKLPAFLKATVEPRKRYRLMELMQPSEQLGVYTPSAQKLFSTAWFAPFIKSADRPVRVIAENIVALIVMPRLSVADEALWKKQNPSKPGPFLAPSYQYDSANPANTNKADPLLNTINQLPPVVQVVMVAIDEPSARRLEDRYGSDQYLGINYTPDQLTSLNLFTDPAVLDDNATTGKTGDLSRIQNSLVSRKLSYRIFSTNVSIRGAKWSRSQVN